MYATDTFPGWAPTHRHTWTYEQGRFTGEPSRVCPCGVREFYYRDDVDGGQ